MQKWVKITLVLYFSAIAIAQESLDCTKQCWRNKAKIEYYKAAKKLFGDEVIIKSLPGNKTDDDYIKAWKYAFVDPKQYFERASSFN